MQGDLKQPKRSATELFNQSRQYNTNYSMAVLGHPSDMHSRFSIKTKGWTYYLRLALAIIHF